MLSPPQGDSWSQQITDNCQLSTEQAFCLLLYEPLANEILPQHTSAGFSDQLLLEMEKSIPSKELFFLTSSGKAQTNKREQKTPPASIKSHNGTNQCISHKTSRRLTPLFQGNKKACISLSLLIHIFSPPRRTANHISAFTYTDNAQNKTWQGQKGRPIKWVRKGDPEVHQDLYRKIINRLTL